MATKLGFGGEVADFYQRYRRGYPPEVIDALVKTFGLTTSDVALDLGCGTGQLTLPIAARVGAAVGMDPEPDMLARARQVGEERGPRNVSWVLGSDRDVPALGALAGRRRLGAVTIGQALHWMEHASLFRTLVALVRDGGGVAVVTNGRPHWLQDTPWSVGLRGFLEQWLGTTLTDPCGTDESSQSVYRRSLSAAGYEVGEVRVRYTDMLDLDHLVGGVYSALPVDLLPYAGERPAIRERIARAVGDGPFLEDIEVRVLTGLVQGTGSKARIRGDRGSRPQ